MNSQSAADCSRLTKISKPDTGCPSCSPQSHSTAVFSTPIEVAMPSPCSVLRSMRYALFGTKTSGSVISTLIVVCTNPFEGKPNGKAETKPGKARSEEHTSELQSLMRISYAVFCLKQK